MIRAVYLSPDGQLELRRDYPMPSLGSGQCLIRPVLSGVCRTDLELLDGYRGFSGVLGHEFVGYVEACASDVAPHWLDQRVVCEINWGCGRCRHCGEGGQSADARHCPDRRAMGISGWDGAFADRLVAPIGNVRRVPSALSDRQAVFCEPVAAAWGCIAALELEPGDEVLGVGDGRLGLLIAQSLAKSGARVSWCVRHRERTAWLERWGVAGYLEADLPARRWSRIVEASGSASGLALAQSRLQARGTLLLKSTTRDARALDVNSLVIHEWRLQGSRCGRFEPALGALERGDIETEPLISAVYPLDDALEAIQFARQRGVLKVLLRH